jgi:hypothetical protein
VIDRERQHGQQLRAGDDARHLAELSVSSVRTSSPAQLRCIQAPLLDASAATNQRR